MREIKYRAWDLKNKRMIYDCVVEIYSDGGRVVEEFIPLVNSFKLNIDKGIQKKILRNEIMRFTGYLDKNSKEIYEGDILSPGRREVRFEEYYNPLPEQGTGFTTYSHNAKEPWKCPFSFASRQSEGSEIIGNIYENPELLKEDI